MSTAAPVCQPPHADSLADAVRFHLSLNVSDLGRSVEFFRILLDAAPAKLRDDYAKFEIAEPPLVLSLEPSAPHGAGALNHLGFRLSSAAALVEMQRRLEAHGISTQREDGVECCYARQTKFWLHDPDGNLWEVYTLDEDIEHRGLPVQLGANATSAAAPAKPPAEPAASLWSHRLGQPLPLAIFAHDATVDQAKLQGTFNARCSPEQRRTILAEVFRALRPGGTLTLHMLTGERAMDGGLCLPGPAAAVEQIPTARQLVQELEAAGFAHLRFERLSDSPCFVHQDIAMRETVLMSEKLAPDFGASEQRLLYKGPFSQITLDDGTIVRRGEFVSVADSVAAALLRTEREDFAVEPPTVMISTKQVDQ